MEPSQILRYGKPSYGYYVYDDSEQSSYGGPRGAVDPSLGFDQPLNEEQLQYPPVNTVYEDRGLEQYSDGDDQLGGYYDNREYAYDPYEADNSLGR